MKYRAYLDIETTGLSRYYCDLTVIGIALEKGRKAIKFGRCLRWVLSDIPLKALAFLTLG